MNSFEKSQSTAFDRLNVFILFVARILVLFLEILNESLEVIFQFFHGRLFVLDFLFALGSTKSHELIDLLLLVIAQVQICWPACWSETVRELLQSIVISATF